MCRAALAFGVAGAWRWCAMSERQVEHFTPQPLPKGVRKRKAKRCYRNAVQLVLANPDVYFYSEGYAKGPATNLWYPHAWAVDHEGRVVDQTWPNPEDCRYIGVKFTAKQYALATLDSEIDSVFPNLNCTTTPESCLGGRHG